MKILLIFILLNSFFSISQNQNGVLKGILYIDSISNVAEDFFTLTVIETKSNEILHTSMINQNIMVELTPEIYSLKICNKSEDFILKEKVEINYSSITFYNIDVRDLVDR